MLLKLLAVLGLCLQTHSAVSIDNNIYWMKIQADDKFERSVIAETGAAIESVEEDYLIATGSAEELAKVQATGRLQVSFPIVAEMDFPDGDSPFHNYSEMTEKLQKLASENPDILVLKSIGKSVEGRDIWAVQISGDLANAHELPASIFMGGHHAREHLSVELPIYYIDYLVAEYKKGNPRIRQLVDARDIHMIPMVNPDGAEYDIEGGRYKSWRKNRTQNKNGAWGVDLNRNYGYGWGGAGASTSPNSDTYRGASPFSEPESQAVKAYVESHENITVLLSFHTYSELILYPYGHVYEGISNTMDKQVHEVMAKKMSSWNGYKPQQSSELYLASGDTTDWSYGEHKIISFTFELDPSPWGGGGFYPGAGVIPKVQQKNLEPVLYLIENSSNPYQVLQ